MVALTNFFCFLLLCFVNGSSRINLDLTNWIDDSQGNVIFEHDCLHVAVRIEKENDPYQIISYCMGESSSQWNIEVDNLIQSLTFDQLYKLNVDSEQLYFWSSPIDVIERYQLYINKVSKSSNEYLPMGKELFFNCTLPRFGNFCQYSLDIYENNNFSLNDIIYNYYQQEYNPTELTCYIHLKCNRGSDSLCLDWSDICDRYVDCEYGVDEEHCWQLEMNECEDNEFRCENGQCISFDFWRDGENSFECLDKTDESKIFMFSPGSIISIKGEPTFLNEDILCSRIPSISLGVRMTSSCVLERDKLVVQSMFSSKPKLLSDECWSTFKCMLNEEHLMDSTCEELYQEDTFVNKINNSCPNLIMISNGPIAFGHIYFLYTKKNAINSRTFKIPQYICYNDKLCSGLKSNVSILLYNNMTCRTPKDFLLFFDEYRINPVTTAIRSLYRNLFKCNTILYNNSLICNSSIMYRCINSSKCIPKLRLCDGTTDCDYGDDEQCSFIDDSCSKNQFLTLFKCSTANMCVHPLHVGNGICDCDINEYGLCDDEITHLTYIRTHISFQTICDGFTELLPIYIDGKYHTDEIECEQWECNNTYTRCDGFWNCLNGIDELDCHSSLSSLLKCPVDRHICLSPETDKLMCLPVEKANDGIIDCLGATDEPKLCQKNHYQFDDKYAECVNKVDIRCANTKYLCYLDQCANEMNKQFCDNAKKFFIDPSICNDEYPLIRSHIEMFFCEYLKNGKAQMVHFSLHGVRKSTKNTTYYLSTITETTHQYEQRCHRGLGLHVWLNNKQNLTNITCLCPPSYYGNRCQYQNERVSLTLKFGTYSDSRRTSFAIVVLLIDNNEKRTIYSHQQFLYLYIRHCKVKFNIYLLYSARSKNQTKNYSVHIDVYEKKISLKPTYRASFISTIKFNFLPLHRIALRLKIPSIDDKIKTCIDHQCIHGQCIKYSNTKHDLTFCQCDEGWSGKYCNIAYKCTCSSDSLCLGILANNRSLCVCPMNKWGPQCFLRSMICQYNNNETCLNDGTCIPIDENVISQKKFLCICPKGFSGNRCEIHDAKLILSFDKDIILPEYIIVHFIEIIPNAEHINGSTFQIISLNENSVTIYWSHPFHIAFVELNDNDYYLISVKKTFNRSEIIIQTINSLNRCKHISEVLNKTLVNFHLIRRIKYYHLPCQNSSSNLSCFYDDDYFCLCNNFDLKRLSNCFEFNSTRKLDCSGESKCQNGANCIQDSNICPQISICVCEKCYYGTLCQFSSNLFGLSLDAFLGYYIQPHISIRSQPSIVQISLILIIIITIGGLVNGIFSLITFKSKESCQTGSGCYLLSASITTVFTMIIFALKFFILLIAQMTYITNRSFLSVQCYSMDFFLQVGLNIDRWLCACVAIERSILSIQGTKFNKQKSKKISKYIIFIVISLIMITHIPDSIHRRLIDDNDNDNDEKRIWCIVSYSSFLQIFNSTINLIHFFIPFLINLISPIIIIKVQIQQRLTVQPDQNYRQLFYEQCRRHTHLLIASVVLIILSIPRLFISFISTCMKSSGSNSWILLFGYIISFIPLILHFILFVLPSKLFKHEFPKRIRFYQKITRRRLYLTL